METKLKAYEVKRLDSNMVSVMGYEWIVVVKEREELGVISYVER